jgi:3-oxoacyl-[acyl-carrier-protein] synthase III
MAFVKVSNVSVKGVSVCVPPKVMENKDYEIIPKNNRARFIQTIGIERRRVVEPGVCTSDLCLKAAENLISKLNWEKKDISLLVFVSQTPDYKMPSTACVLQHRLNLPKESLAFDVSQGCTGFPYGLSIGGSLMSSGNIKKALIMVGNTQSLNTNYYDQSTYPLFGDAGSVTALEFSEEETDEMFFGFLTDGSGENAIIIPDGGFRNPVSTDSFKLENFEGGIKRTRLNLKMEGEDVFSFVIRQVPKTINSFFGHFQIDSEQIDYFLLHHASRFLCEKLRKKMKFPEEKVPYVLNDFGNSSNASIPLLMVTELKEVVQSSKTNLFVSGFGVGLSVGVGSIYVDKLKCADLVIY